jgi:hypothetical protein
MIAPTITVGTTCGARPLFPNAENLIGHRIFGGWDRGLENAFVFVQRDLSGAELKVVKRTNQSGLLK